MSDVKPTHEQALRAQLARIPRYKCGILMTPDFSSPDIRIGGFVTVVPRSNNKHRDYFTAFRSFPDHENGIMWGYPQDQDGKTGAVKFRQIRIDISRVFNLDHLPDIMEFYVLQHHYDLIVSPKSELVIDDPEEKALNEIKGQNARIKADKFISEADDEKIKELVRVLLGIDPSRTSLNVCRSQLSKMCMTEPKRILSKMEDKDFEYQSLFAQLKEVGLVKESISRGWLYRDGLPLGNTPEGVITYMKNDPDWTMTLRKELRELNKGTAVSNKPPVKTEIPEKKDNKAESKKKSTEKETVVPLVEDEGFGNEKDSTDNF